MGKENTKKANYNGGESRHVARRVIDTVTMKYLKEQRMRTNICCKTKLKFYRDIVVVQTKHTGRPA